MEQYKRLLIVFIGALYFFFDSILIVLPSGLITPLMNKYSITATGLSFLAAIYFYSYSLLQLPNGLLIDRFGPKRIAMTGLLICAFSLFIFSISNTYIFACIARLLMGVGASAGYLVPMILAVRWIDKKYYVMTIGFIVFIECLGAIFGQVAIIHVYYLVGLERTTFILAGFSIFLLALVFFFVTDDYSSDINVNEIEKKYGIIFFDLIKILKAKYYWLIALCATLFWGPAALFASLWGINFIVINNHISTLVASHVLIFIWMGIGMGGPLIGLVLKYFDDKLQLMLFFSIVGFFISIFIIYFSYSTIFLSIYLFILGLTCAAQVLTFGIIRDYAPENILATAFGFNNMAICLGNAVFQMIAGYLLDIFWKHESYHGVRLYSLITYKKMLLLMPMCYVFIAGFVLILKYSLFGCFNINDCVKKKTGIALYE